jgi:crossover junction endodeoxyribonuclease RusA
MQLILPYPISANRYWQHGIAGNPGHVVTFVSKEAKRYKNQVKIAAYEQGCRAPIPGRVRVLIELYPHRPIDWQKRMRRNPMNWDDDVQRLDLDNARKVLNDALSEVAFIDDKWIWEDGGRVMEPDAEGERVVVTIEPIVRASPQPVLWPEREVVSEANA